MGMVVMVTKQLMNIVQTTTCLVKSLGYYFGELKFWKYQVVLFAFGFLNKALVGFTQRLIMKTSFL
jgi:hypothetical protein